jgi:restriction endonuclease S subunit
MSFALSKAVNPSKVFIEQKTNVTGRWDPFYFRPELVALEKRVRKVTPHRLKEFVCSMAGGATPSTAEAETHYTESAEGVPFIRVQNLSTTGRLNLDDCKRITRSTHEGLLKRSRLSGGELLVKITGVGRMAVASVVPEGFEGNINQHMVAIRTKDIATSETLAAYLNLDMAERLASRRSTGGTRPALDYPALLSIPIVFDERIPLLMQVAVKQHQEQVKKAEALLATIDDVLLGELGIPRKPEPLNTLESRIFRRDFSSVSGKRIDPAANWRRLSLGGGKFSLRRLRDVASINPVTRFPKLEPGTPVSFVPMDAVSDVFGEIADRQTRPIEEAGSYTPFQDGDVIWAKITPCMENGKAAVADGLVEGVGYGSTEFHVFRRRSAELFPHYLHHLLRLKTVRDHARRNFTGSSGHQRVDEDFFHRMEIPFPPMKIQERIAEKAEATKAQARKLFADSRADLEKAKRDIEALILGKEAAE